jgi:aspartate aminotransferase-like enzyme
MFSRDRVRAPGPTPLPDSSRRAMAQKPGYHRTEQFSAVLEDVVGKLRRMLDVDWPILPMAASGTGAMEAAVLNAVPSGETALVIEAGKFGSRWRRMLESVGAEVVSVEVEWGSAVEPEKVFSKLRTHDVEAVFATAVETSTLTRHPMETIGNHLADRPELFVVDAISVAGAEPFWPGEYSMDFVVLGAQKGLMGPPGLSFLAVSPDAEKRSRDVRSPTTYFDVPTAIDRQREDWQTPWTPPMQLLRAQQSSLERYFREGQEAVFERHRRLAELCRERVQELGLELFSEKPAVAGTAVVVPGELDGTALQEHIYESYNCYIPGGQKQYAGELLRIGHLGHVDRADLIGTLDVLEQALDDFDGENS